MSNSRQPGDNERNWPHAQSRRFVSAAGLSWNVLDMGQGPVLLLLHGTGSSVHSWRDLVSMLARRFRVVAVDLPGHGFTQSPPRDFLSLSGMAIAVSALLRVMQVSPEIVAGHSAGAALAARMTMDGWIAPKAIVGVNAALVPFQGLAGQLFAPVARILARFPLLPEFFARRSINRSLVQKMLADTGSTLDAAGIDYYWSLMQKPSHVAAALGMMAEWDLPRLNNDLVRLKASLILLAATNDRTVPPHQALAVQKRLPQTRVVPLEGLGHLAHEEQPEPVSRLILEIAESAHVLKPSVEALHA